MGLKGFRLLSSSITAVIEGVCVFLSIISNYRYIKVFKLLAYLSIKARLAVLPKDLYYYNLLLLEGLSYLKATAFYRVFIEFLYFYFFISVILYYVQYCTCSL